MKHEFGGTLMSYIIGFIFSILFTLAAYFMVVNHSLGGTALVASILVLAVLQMFVQLLFFLHMGKEPKPYWNSTVFISFVGIILIIVIGSLWIMYHLNYNMMSQQMETKILNDEHMEMPGVVNEETQKEIKTTDDKNN